MYIILIIEDLDHVQVIQNKEGETKLFYTKESAQKYEDKIVSMSKIVKV